jgi:hypothetical protein
MLIKTFLWLLLFTNVCWAGTLLPNGLEPTVSMQETGDVLTLRGMGVFKEAEQDYYLGAYYSLNKNQTPQEALQDNGPQRIAVYFLKPASHFRELMEASIEANNSPETIEREQLNIGQFLDFLTMSFQKNDIVLLDFIPNVGMKVTINGVYKGTIKSNQFYNLILKVWMGRQPPSKKFQKDLFYLSKGIHI